MSIKCAQPQWWAVVAHFNPSPQKTEASRLGGGDRGVTRQKGRKKQKKKSVLNHSGIYRTEGRLVNKLKKRT